MLLNNMTLKEMLDFKPSDEDMLSLDLSVVVYIKLLIISKDTETNNSFIRFLFENEEFNEYFIETSDTSYYEFNSKDNKYLTITELFAKHKFEETKNYLKDILETYKDEAIYSFNLYTHDNHSYSLHNIEGFIELEENK